MNISVNQRQPTVRISHLQILAAPSDGLDRTLWMCIFILFHVFYERKESKSNEDRSDTLSPSYYNQLPGRLHRELETARRVGVRAVEIPSKGFDSSAIEGARMIYVAVDGHLIASKRQVDGEHISHAVLANGGPVQAAGEFEIETEHGAPVVSVLNNMSGHYRPATASLEVARRAFESAGIPVLPGVVRSYDYGIS